MEVAGLCAECGRPGTLSTCPFCGAHICAECRQTGRHNCQRRSGLMLGEDVEADDA